MSKYKIKLYINNDLFSIQLSKKILFWYKTKHIYVTNSVTHASNQIDEWMQKYSRGKDIIKII